jgi:hypothetical protein
MLFLVEVKIKKGVADCKVKTRGGNQYLNLKKVVTVFTNEGKNFGSKYPLKKVVFILIGICCEKWI